MNEQESKKDVIYLVPHTHYDAAWVFTKEDYFYIYIDLIMKKVVELMEREKDFKFMIEQTFLLEELERRFPEIFSKIAEYIKEGRFEIADGERLMADTMLTQEETIIREIVLGKKYVKDKFGIDVPVMWQADSFGLNAQLPQVYRKSGYKWMAFRRGCPDNRPSEFYWEGLDGTKIMSHWMPLGYRAGLDLNKLGESYKKLKELAYTNHILMPSGSGSMAPLPELLQAAKDWNKKEKDAEMRVSTPSEFFSALEKDAKDLPIRRGEMYSSRYSYIFPDCCSSRIWIKKSLRKYENWLLSFERFLSILEAINPSNYRSGKYLEELGDLWEKVLFLGFHDVVPGTGMDGAYDEVREYIGYLRTKLSYLHPKVVGSLVEADSNEEEEGDIAVFNPLSWEVTNWVEVDLNFEEGEITKIGGLKSGDEIINVDLIRFTRHDDESIRYARVGFVAKLPAVGYKVYKIVGEKAKKINVLKVKGNVVENSYFRARFEPESGLIDVFLDGRRVCKANDLVLEEETGDLYYHKESIGAPIKTESGEGFEFGSFRMRNFWIDKSPLRRVINVETDYYSLRWPYRLTNILKGELWRHNFLRINKKIIIYRDLPRIDFITTVKNEHPRLRLRARFSTDIRLPEYTCDSQFGPVKRPTNQYYFSPEGWMDKPAPVFPSLRWIDYSNGEVGLTVMNKGTPENEVRDGNIYITLLRCVGMLSSDGKAGPLIPVPDARETKTYTFTYSIYPHKGDWKEAKSYKQGYEFNYSPWAFQLPKDKKLRRMRSFVNVSPDNVVMTALKPSEDGKGLVLRLYETAGETTESEITLFAAPKKAVKTNLLEDESQDESHELPFEKNSIKLAIKPYEIVTVKMIFG